MQAGKFTKSTNLAGDGITMQGGKFVIFLKYPGRSISQTCKNEPYSFMKY